jgi:hypothetical protein
MAHEIMISARPHSTLRNPPAYTSVVTLGDESGYTVSENQKMKLVRGSRRGRRPIRIAASTMAESATGANSKTKEARDALMFVHGATHALRNVNANPLVVSYQKSACRRNKCSQIGRLCSALCERQ